MSCSSKVIADTRTDRHTGPITLHGPVMVGSSTVISKLIVWFFWGWTATFCTASMVRGLGDHVLAPCLLCDIQGGRENRRTYMMYREIEKLQPSLKSRQLREHFSEIRFNLSSTVAAVSSIVY